MPSASDYTKASERPISEMNLDTPFVEWFTRYSVAGEADYNTGDVLMGRSVSKRFSIGIDDNKRTIIGVPDYEATVLESFTISKVAFVRKIKNSDWLVIYTDDATHGRDLDINEKNVLFPLRIWIPVEAGILDAWNGYKKDVYFCLVDFLDNMPFIKEETPFASCSMETLGKWEGLEEFDDDADLTIDPEEAEEVIEVDIDQVRHSNKGNVVPELSLDEIEFEESFTVEGEGEVNIDDFLL